MANVCICCGKKTGMLLGWKKLYDNDDMVICDNCYYKFSTPVNIMKAGDNIETLVKQYNEIIEKVRNNHFSSDGEAYVIKYITEIKNTKIAELTNSIQEQEAIKKQIAKLEHEAEIKHKEDQERIQKIITNRNNHLVTTGYNFEGYLITKYNGIISGSVVLGTGFLSELGASFSDLFGSQSNMFADKLETARRAAMQKLVSLSAEKGGNAVIGVDFDYITFSNNMIGVVANGTSVVIEKE